MASSISLGMQNMNTSQSLMFFLLLLHKHPGIQQQLLMITFRNTIRLIVSSHKIIIFPL